MRTFAINGGILVLDGGDWCRVDFIACKSSSQGHLALHALYTFFFHGVSADLKGSMRIMSGLFWVFTGSLAFRKMPNCKSLNAL